MNNSQNRFCIILIFFLFLVLVYLPSVYADEYYADISINVDDSGFVIIDGVTNHPNLLAENTEVYTSKKQSYWLLNITKEEVFSDFIFSLTLPQRSSINYITSSGSFRIEADADNLVVKGFGENESFSVVVQYQINKTSDENLSLDWNVLLILGFFILILIIFLVFAIFQNKRKNLACSNKKLANDVDHDLRGLNNRQKKIIKLLIDHNRPLTQAEIQKELNIPKAAVSRNIHSLEIKGLIEIEKIGMSNLIRLKKK